MQRDPSGKPQQPPNPPDVVEVLRNSSGETQQPPAGDDVVEVFRADPAAAKLAASQDGAVTRAQLRDAGLSDDQVDHRVAQARLHRQHRAVYLLGHEVAAEHAPQIAAVLALGDHAYLSHRSALEVYGILDPLGGPIHVTVIGCCRRSRDGIRVHRTTRIGPEDYGALGNLRITSPCRAILDFAEYGSPGQVGRAVNQAHVDRVATPAELRALVARTPGRRGAALLTAILDRHDGPARLRSGGERIVLALLKRARLRKPEVNARVHGEEVDFHYGEEKVAIELDGGQSHGTPAAVDRDRRKDALLRSHDYEVLRYSWWQIDEEPEAVVAEIAATLERRRRS